jgi:hypothetical protein
VPKYFSPSPFHVLVESNAGSNLGQHGNRLRNIRGGGILGGHKERSTAGCHRMKTPPESQITRVGYGATRCRDTGKVRPGRKFSTPATGVNRGDGGVTMLLGRSFICRAWRP